MSTIAQQVRQQGVEQGEKIGITKGHAEMAKSIARKLLVQNVASVETIAHMTNLPICDVIAIQKDM